ncbi:MAG TPA: O-methyltransferase [Acidobacteriota bacterium]|jgi:predicted O-methyltransferase YrrM
MEPIVDKDVEKYIYDLLPERDDVLMEIEQQARKRSIPIIGPAVARVIYQYARIAGAKHVFEMGSAIGYSTIWLARAVGKDGKVYYTDGDPKNAAEARSYFERSGVEGQIEVMVGDAFESLDKVKGEFDLIFNDVDKHQYPQAFRKAVPRIRKGGLLITDNVLWSGRVARGDKDANTEGVREFNRLIYSSKQLYPTILPIRDGIAVCVKL